MRHTQKTSRLITLAATAVVACQLGAGTAFAQTANESSTIRATVYGFVPNLSGTTAFPTPLGNTFDLNNETLLDNTDLALMGLVEVQKGRVGAFTDVMYFNLGVNKSITRDVALPGAPALLPVTATAGVDVKAWVVMAAANIRAISNRSLTVDVFGGARRLEATATLDYAFNSPLGPVAAPGTVEDTNGNWDGIGGVRGRVGIGRLIVPFYLDAGAGDSDLTWQVMAGVAYSLRHVEMGVVYRYLDYDMKADGRKIGTLTFDGPTAGVTFKW